MRRNRVPLDSELRTAHHKAATLTLDLDHLRPHGRAPRPLPVDMLLSLGTRQPRGNDVGAPPALVRDVAAAVGGDEVLELEVGDFRSSRAVDGNDAASCLSVNTLGGCQYGPTKNVRSLHGSAG